MLVHNFCGLDFGTSNSTIGILKNEILTMVPLEQGKPIIRSAIFFESDTNTCQFGQRGVNDYLSGIPGRLLMSLKSVLGSSLMQETTLIQGKRVPYTEILGCLIRYIKQQAEQEAGHELNQVVLGRPVHFHDQDNKKDQLAQNTLEKIVRDQGFKTVLFQYEPIAAAIAYEQTIFNEQLALIVDLGGGTSDFTVIRLRPPLQNRQNDRTEDVLANDGIHIGGTDFDTRFSLREVMPQLGLGSFMQGISNSIPIPASYYHDLTTWHTIHNLYTHSAKRSVQSIWNMAFEKKPIERLLSVMEKQQGHKILYEVEQGKCLLSQSLNACLDLSFMEDGFVHSVTRERFQEMIIDKVSELIETLLNTVKMANVNTGSIHSIFFTGGSTQIPIIRQQIAAHFPSANLVQGDVFNSVGKGLIIDAKQRLM